MKKSLFSLAIVAGTLFSTQAQELNFVSRFATGSPDTAETLAYDSGNQHVILTNSSTNSFMIVDVQDPINPILVKEIDLSPYGAGPNSSAVVNNYIAIAVEANNKTDNGHVVVFDLNGNYITKLEVGALPDMLAVSPDGKKLLVANEGEPNEDYTIDPEGSVSIIDLEGNVVNVSFSILNDRKEELLEKGIRIFGNNGKATVAQDLEPEYIAFSADSKEAYVSMQENNAFAIINLETNRVEDIIPYGYKDHSLEINAFDASNKDDKINITTHPTWGMFMPDAIASYSINGDNYIVTANEGDARDYDGYSEEVRVKDLTLNPEYFPNAKELQSNENLGRLKTTTANGDIDGDGTFEKIYSYGARSFSIFDQTGNLIFDSGNDFETIVAEVEPSIFNQDEGEFDGRSDDKGVEPEAVALGEINDRTYAFIGFERQNGIIVYDVTDPTSPEFITYYNNDTDMAPEIIKFLGTEDSPNGKPMLLVGYEVSGTLSLIEIQAENLSVISTEIEDNDFKIFPNPAVNNQIYFNKQITGTIFNYNGQKIMDIDKEKSLFVGNLPKGIYIIQTQENGSKRFLKK